MPPRYFLRFSYFEFFGERVKIFPILGLFWIFWKKNRKQKQKSKFRENIVLD